MKKQFIIYICIALIFLIGGIFAWKETVKVFEKSKETSIISKQARTDQESQNSQTSNIVKVKGLVRDFISEEPLDGIEIFYGLKKLGMAELGSFQFDGIYASTTIDFIMEGYNTQSRIIAKDSENIVDLGYIDLVPSEEILFNVFHNPRPYVYNAFVVKTTYDGVTSPPLIERILQRRISHDLKKIIYTNFDYITRHYSVKMFDINGKNDSREITTYSSDKFGVPNGFEWSPDSKKVIWTVIENKSHASLLQYFDITNNELGLIPHPFLSGTDYSREVFDYTFSPDGDFIAFIHREREESVNSIALYQFSTRRIENIRDGRIVNYFFDFSGKVYYEDVINQKRWIIYDPYTQKREYFNTEPAYWQKYKGFLIDLKRNIKLSFCDYYTKQPKIICISDAKGENEKKLDPIEELREGYYDASLSLDGKYVIIAPYFENYSLWVASTKTGRAKKILEWDKDKGYFIKL